MSYIETNSLKNSTIMFIYSEKDQIQLDPDYQRMGGVWTQEKKQLLIDSIINDYDVPKLYFHEFSREQKLRNGFEYAVVDGLQRLQTIWDFMDGRFSLSGDFEYLKDPSVNLRGLSYEDMAKEHPKIRIAFDSFVLPIVAIRTDDEDLIEDMFSRLNEAVPLNAAEKRNAIGGDMVAAIREISMSRLFDSQVRFSNNRYQHREVAARILLAELTLHTQNRLIDTKKVYIDNMAKQFSAGSRELVMQVKSQSFRVIESMEAVFTERDELLQSQGNMVVFYLLFRFALIEGKAELITRRKLLDFREKLKSNRLHAELDFAESSFELLEYDRLSQQGTNDASNIKERLNIIWNEMEFDSPPPLI